MRVWIGGQFASLMSLACAALLGGCQAEGSRVANPMSIEARQYDLAYEASIEVLRDAGFRLDQRDYRFGQVSTHPKGSPVVLEFWQRDNSTIEQAWLSTLSDVRRRVQVQLEPTTGDQTDDQAEQGRQDAAEAARPYRLSVEVIMQRRQVPVRRMTGSVRTGVFSELDEVPAEWRRRGIPASYWETIGRDPHLERRLLQRIARRTARMEPAGPW